MVTDTENWKIVAAVIHDALPEIDKMFSQVNMPITSRPSKAFDIVRDTMLEVSDWKTFFLSTAHGKILTIINDWYHGRYGKISMVLPPEKVDTLSSLFKRPICSW
ncbi:MAG: hypothetical protein OYH77_01410 [Pseudomonadota bacterium]|nr:hypothetical protein [Pseudomonadota bacterium]